MEYFVILKALTSLGIVFVIMFILLKILQRSTKIGVKSKGTHGINSLKVGNIVYIDENTKIVSVMSETGNNYVLAIGKNNMLLLEKSKITKEQELHE